MSEFIPYGRQVISDRDIEAVTRVLKGDWLTTGPTVPKFEEAFAEFVGANHAVAVCNGTAALHIAMIAAGIGPGDEVIVSSLTFAASANCVRYVGGTVIFADVMEDTLTIDPEHVASLVTDKTKAIVAVDYAGLAVDLDALRSLCDQHDLLLIEDASHAPGATYHGRKIGSIADMTTFSLHPVKHFTTGEGGFVTTNDDRFATKLQIARNHGITSDHRQRQNEGTWRYDMVSLGLNYRLTDLQCALGISQLEGMPTWLDRRQAIADRYDRELADLPITLPVVPEGYRHAWHLYAIRIDGENAAERRQSAFVELRKQQIGVNVHYLPVYLLSYYQELGYPKGLCPRAEKAYDGLISIPMSHALTDEQQGRVIEVLHSILG